MKKGLTELVFILDRSGSMHGLEADTIGGFNSLIERQRSEPGEALVSTVLFNDNTQVLHDRVRLDEVQPITEREYRVGGCTALLDAIGGAIHHIGNVHKYARSEDVPEHTLFVITTDGMENASRVYTAQKVRRLGVPLPGRQHRRRGDSGPHWHFPRQGGQLQLRQRGHPPQLRSNGRRRLSRTQQRTPGRALEGRHRGGLPQTRQEMKL